MASDQFEQHMRQFFEDRTRGWADQVVAWGNAYFDAYAWVQRARWVFSQQYGYTYALVEDALQRRNNDKPLYRDHGLLVQWDAAITRCGDIDQYVLAQAQTAPELIDLAIGAYWEHHYRSARYDLSLPPRHPRPRRR